jgi:hypothetical protein
VEVKWVTQRVKSNVLNDLWKKAEKFQWHNTERKEVFVIYSKSGFEVKTKDAILISMNDMERDLLEMND